MDRHSALRLHEAAEVCEQQLKVPQRPGVTMAIPTAETIRTAVAQYDANPRTSLADQGLAWLFTAVPDNSDERRVLLKVTTLNALYSTQIYDVISVARHIVALNLDPVLKAESLDAVPKVAAVTLKGKVRNFYSFASKYCAWHRPDIYPIFDDYVSRRLTSYRKAFKFAKFSAAGLRDYPTFVSVMSAFTEHFELTTVSLRDVDKFLWLEGRRGS